MICLVVEKISMYEEMHLKKNMDLKKTMKGKKSLYKSKETYYIIIQCNTFLVFSSRMSHPCLPPPWLWHRYGNLQTLPSPTQKPTQVSRYWALLSHCGLSPASSFSILSRSLWEGILSSSPGFGNFSFMVASCKLHLTLNLKMYPLSWLSLATSADLHVPSWITASVQTAAGSLSTASLSQSSASSVCLGKRDWDNCCDLWDLKKQLSEWQSVWYYEMSARLIGKWPSLLDNG